MLKLGIVVDIHPEDNAVDLLMLDDGSRVPGVQVMSMSASSNTGLADLTMPDRPRADKWDPQKSNTRDIIAVVALTGMKPIVLGFLFPQVSQMLFADKNRRVFRHASDVYTVIDDDGNVELYHPSGTYFRIGETAAHEDLTGQDYDGQWKISRNTDKAVHVRLRVAAAGTEKANVSITPGGDLSAVVAGDITLDAAGDIIMTGQQFRWTKK